jgi:hypothetical protein
LAVGVDHALGASARTAVTVRWVVETMSVWITDSLKPSARHWD